MKNTGKILAAVLVVWFVLVGIVTIPQRIESAALAKKGLPGQNVSPVVYDPENGWYYVTRGATGSQGVPFVQLWPGATSTVTIATDTVVYSDVEYVTCTMLAGVATTCSPSAVSFEYSFQNATAAIVFVKENAVSANHDGDMYLAGAAKGYWGMEVTSLSVYNTGVQATATIVFRR